MRTRLVLMVDLVAGLAWVVVGLAVMAVIGASLESGLAEDDPARVVLGAWAVIAGLMVAGVGMIFTFRLVGRRLGKGAGTRYGFPGVRGPGPGAARAAAAGRMPVLRPNTLRQDVAQGGWTKPGPKTIPAKAPRFLPGRPAGPFASARLAPPPNPFAPARMVPPATAFAPARPASPFAPAAPTRSGSTAPVRVARVGAVVMALVAGLLLLGAAAEGADAELWLPIPFLVLAGMLLAAGGPDVRGERLALRGAAVFVAPLLLGIAAAPTSADSILLAAAVLFVGAVVVIGVSRAFGRGLARLFGR